MRVTLRLEPGQRLDQAIQLLISQRYPLVSRRQIKQCIDSGIIARLSHSETISLSPSLRAELTALTIEISIDEPQLQSILTPEALLPRSEGCSLRVLHEDAELLVLDKPSGLPSAPLSSSAEPETAVHHALAHFPGLPPTDPREPGLLHRLDTGTSGCLAFAKTEESFHRIKRAWRLGQVKKFYRARVAQAPSCPLPYQIDLPLGHDPKSSRKMKVITDSGKIRGKPLEARTTLLEARHTHDNSVELLIELHTGVMHQIRVHLAHLEAPILGDTLYGGARSSRMWLHCEALGVPSPAGSLVWIRSEPFSR